MRVGRRVRAAVGRIGEPPHLPLVAVVPERGDVEVDRRAALPCLAGAVDAGHDHHAVGGSSGAVSLGRVVAALGGQRADEAPPHVDDVEREKTRRRAREPACDRRRQRAQHVDRGVDRRPEGVEDRAREPGHRVECSETAADGVVRAVAEPCCDVARAREHVAHERDARRAAVVAIVAVVTGRGRARRRELECGRQLAPLVGRGPRALGRWIGRGEAHHLGEVERAEQHHRVEVAVAEPEAEVQHAVAMVIAAVTLVGRAAGGGDRVAALDHVAGVHGDRRKEGVRRAETAGVDDGDVQRARDRAGERNLAAVGSPDRRTGAGGEVDAAMAGAVHRRRRRECPHDGAVDGTHPRAWARRVGPGWLVGARDVDGQGEDEGDDERGDEAPRR